jgi:hypothetical protein
MPLNRGLCRVDTIRGKLRPISDDRLDYPPTAPFSNGRFLSPTLSHGEHPVQRVGSAALYFQIGKPRA